MSATTAGVKVTTIARAVRQSARATGRRRQLPIRPRARRDRIGRPLVMGLLALATGTAPTSARADSWTLVNTPGFGDPANVSALSMAVFAGHLYVPTRNPSGSQVWRGSLSTGVWREVTPPWDPATEAVEAVAVFENQLYLGTNRGELWRTSGPLELLPCQPPLWARHCLPPGLAPSAEGELGNLWQNVSPSAGDWVPKEITSLAVFRGELYLAREDPLEIWRWTVGGNWERKLSEGIDGDFLNNHGGVLATHGDHLYVGTRRMTAGSNGPNLEGLEIWRSLNGTTWDALVANGVLGAVASGFGFPGNGTASALASFRQELYVSTVDHVDGAQVWRFDGTAWTEVTPAQVSDPMAGVFRLQRLATFGTRLFVGQGIAGHEAWVLATRTGDAWESVNEEGFGEGLNTAVDAMAASPGHLYVATQNPDGVRIWQKETSRADYFDPQPLVPCLFGRLRCAPLPPPAP